MAVVPREIYAPSHINASRKFWGMGQCAASNWLTAAHPSSGTRWGGNPPAGRAALGAPSPEASAERHVPGGRTRGRSGYGAPFLRFRCMRRPKWRASAYLTLDAFGLPGLSTFSLAW